MIKIFRNIVGGVCLAAMASCSGSQDGATSNSGATTGEYANSTIETILTLTPILRVCCYCCDCQGGKIF